MHGFALNCDCDLGAFDRDRAVRHRRRRRHVADAPSSADGVGVDDVRSAGRRRPCATRSTAGCWYASVT